MSEIGFFSEDISFEPNHKQELINWITDVICEHAHSVHTINYVFCSDEYLLRINHQYLSHNTYTDIITFNNSEVENQIEADIFISIPRVTENACEYSKSFESELHRVMIHGILHLLGYEDSNEYEKQQMREKEEACLSLLKILK